MSENHDGQQAEFAVRRYLEFLADPTSVIDQGRISHLETSITNTSDVIEKLKLHTELASARVGDASALRTEFAQAAKGWATTHDVSVDAFRALGVSDIALAEAGFQLSRTGPAKSRTAPSTRGSRAASVSSSVVRDHVLALTDAFTLGGVMASVGGSMGTVRKVLDELEATNKVKNEGADPNHSGRGRAPHVFRVQ
jgi:hypothetical protein